MARITHIVISRGEEKTFNRLYITFGYMSLITLVFLGKQDIKLTFAYVFVSTLSISTRVNRLK